MAAVTAGIRAARAIVALDASSLARAMALVDSLGDSCDFYKVGSELFTAAGPEAVIAIRQRGHDVFLDLKFHDIPNTVRGAVRSASTLGASLVTVHASGGADMISAAVEGAATGCRVLAVTVLTSLDARGLSRSWGRDVGAVEDEVLRLAALARASGAHGIVCSALEASAVRAAHGDALELLVPGVRMDLASTDDQARVATPAEAIAAGADYVVLGRAVTAAADPRAAMRRVKEMLR
ncbi:MAG TPA: orotidine-5'-phosphate decarboxylase [Gemmatimonadaceae bacterium]|nr:orotidine-5'-phosphate decarboxylase [Gemmatimonadaceae bacterium]